MLNIEHRMKNTKMKKILSSDIKNSISVIPISLLAKSQLIILILSFLLPLSLRSEGSFSSLEIPYSVRSLSMAAVGVADRNGLDATAVNPALIRGRAQSLMLSIIRYPADIQSAFVEWSVPWDNRTVAMSLRRLDYGTFEKRDEDGMKTGQFIAGDTWFSASYARALFPVVDVGATAGLFFSQIENVDAILALVTIGTILKIPKFDAQIGFSIQNFGVSLDSYTKYAESIPLSVNMGFSKKLAHLPLELSIDGIWWRREDRGVVKIGGEFTLPFNFLLRWGTSTYRLNQTTGSLSRDIITGTSFGLGYTTGSLTMEVGMHYAGVGGAAIGAGLVTTL